MSGVSKEERSVKLHNGDAVEYLKAMPSESVDLICTDVPYRTTSRGNVGTMSGYWMSDLTKKGMIFENNAVEPSEYLGEFYRVLKDGTHCYIMINNLNLIEMLNEAVRAGFHFVKSLIWDKGAKICGTYYMGAFEYILFFRKGKDRPINNCGTSDILSIPMSKQKGPEGNLHDTEKPVELMRILVENSSDKGDLVMDPFMGIGSTGVACVQTDRDFIGCEIDMGYFAIAEKRINDANKGGLGRFL